MNWRFVFPCSFLFEEMGDIFAMLLFHYGHSNPHPLNGLDHKLSPPFWGGLECDLPSMSIRGGFCCEKSVVVVVKVWRDESLDLLIPKIARSRNPWWFRVSPIFLGLFQVIIPKNPLTPPDRIGFVRVPIPSEKNRNIGKIPSLGPGFLGNWYVFTPGSTNSSLAGKWGPGLRKDVFPDLKMVILQPAMLVYQRVNGVFNCVFVVAFLPLGFIFHGIFVWNLLTCSNHRKRKTRKI